MIRFIKKNIAVFLLGGIIGGVIAGASLYGVMKVSQSVRANKLTKTFEKRLTAKDVLLSECIAKDTYPTTNQFNPTIDKNKKGNILVSPCPEIKQSNTFTAVRSFKEGDTIGDLTLIKTNKLNRKQARNLGK